MASAAKDLARELCPPVVWRGLQALRRKLAPPARAGSPHGGQDLDVYWDPQMAEVLEHWGDGNAWSEIQFLLASRRGAVLDIACGTGRVMTILAPFAGLEVHGCDISDMLIGKALARGIARERLRVCDATKLPYDNGAFDYSYSIGSLEHFTEDGIVRAAIEAARVTRVASFHMMPTSRSGRDEGWLKTYQSFYNCSPAWWVERLARAFPRATVLDSTWQDPISVGKWFVCER